MWITAKPTRGNGLFQSPAYIGPLVLLSGFGKLQCLVIGLSHLGNALANMTYSPMLDGHQSIFIGISIPIF
jgi:hypothetical protein